MSLPPDDAPELPSADALRRLVVDLSRGLQSLKEQVTQLGDQFAAAELARAALQAEHQNLRDGIAWLKNLPPRPPFKPSGMEKVILFRGTGMRLHRRSEIAGFRCQEYETLQDKANKTAGSTHKINTFQIVQCRLSKQRRYRHQTLQIIHAEELDPPEGRAPVFWKLITNLPVENHAQAVHKLDWYALRWKIETFFRTLKTGCRIEDIRLATADRLANCIALCCIVAWRVSWLTMLGRGPKGASPAAVFTHAERALLERATPDRKRDEPRDLNLYVRTVARLGGYLDRAADPPPGTTVIWRGFSRLADLVEGASIAQSPPASTYG